MLEMYKEFCTKYPVVSIEDPFEQDDWEPAKSLTADNICQVGARAQSSFTVTGMPEAHWLMLSDTHTSPCRHHLPVGLGLAV